MTVLGGLGEVVSWTGLRLTASEYHIHGPALCLVANVKLCKSHELACHSADEAHDILNAREVVLAHACHYFASDFESGENLIASR